MFNFKTILNEAPFSILIFKIICSSGWLISMDDLVIFLDRLSCSISKKDFVRDVLSASTIIGLFS